MKLLCRAGRSALGHPGKTAILAALLVLFALAAMIAAYLTELTKQYQNVLIAENGAYISLETTTEEGFQTVMAQDWTELDGVQWADCYAECTAYLDASAIGGGTAEEVSLSYHSDLSDFRPQLTLKEGELPEDGTAQVLVGEDMAQKYQLAVGQELTLSAEDADGVTTVQISGIFADTGTDENTIFCPASVMSAVTGSSYYILILYPEDTSYLNEIEAQVDQRLSGEDESIAVINPLSSDGASGFSAVAPMLIDISGLLVWGTIAVAGAVAVLVTLLWVRSHSDDMGIYLALGQRRPVIIAQLLLELTVICGLTLLPTLLAGTLLVNLRGAKLVLFLSDFLGYQNYAMVQEMDEQVLELSISPLTVAGSCCLIFILIVLLTGGCSALLLRFGWRGLFERDE